MKLIFSYPLFISSHQRLPVLRYAARPWHQGTHFSNTEKGRAGIFPVNDGQESTRLHGTLLGGETAAHGYLQASFINMPAQ